MLKTKNSPILPFPKPRNEFDSINQKTEKTRERVSASEVRVGKKFGTTPPANLGLIGRECWLDAVSKLRAMRIEDMADEKAVEAFSAAYEEYRLNRDYVVKNGYTYETLSDRGGFRVLKRPEVEIMQSAWMRMRSLLPELCMTPLSRLRAMPPDKDAPKSKDPFSEFIE